MTARQKGTAAYSMPQAARHNVHFTTTQPRELVERVREAAGDDHGALSRWVREALEAALAAQDIARRKR